VEVSVIVRSLGRLPTLCELLPLVLAQRHASFEVLVIEQSGGWPREIAARLAALGQDPRLRIVRVPPLGGPRARNFAARLARGKILLFLDDDDRPAGPDWIAAHAACYLDARCLGVTGRHLFAAGEAPPYRNPARAHARCMAFTPLLKLGYTYARQDRPKRGCDYVHGTNGSLRRSVIDRFGGWDEDTAIEDEMSLALRIARGKDVDEYLAFEPRAAVIRRMDLPGGLGKRFLDAGRYFELELAFVNRILWRYRPLRVGALYPLYVAALYGWTVAWLWADAQAPHNRVATALGLAASVPWRVARQLTARGCTFSP